MTLAFIRECCREVAANLPIDKLYLFGSYARDEADGDSDVDLACSFVKGYTPGLAFASWANQFEASLGKSVDLLSLKGVTGSSRKTMRDAFSRDAIEVYSR